MHSISPTTYKTGGTVFTRGRLGGRGTAEQRNRVTAEVLVITVRKKWWGCGTAYRGHEDDHWAVGHLYFNINKGVNNRG